MIKATAAAALTVLSGLAFAAPSVDANIEMDTNWANQDRGFSQNGRVEFNVAGKTEKGGFVAGRASFLAQKTGGVATDDMWVQFGNASADLKLGRFEAADVNAVGKDTIVDDTGVAGYRNVLRGRFGGSTAHAALTFNASSALSVELGVIADGKATAVRPVVTYSANGLVVRASVDAGHTWNAATEDSVGIVAGVPAVVPGTAASKTKIQGFGLGVSLPVAGGTVNASVGSGKRGDVKSSSVLVNATLGNFGIGYIRDKDEGVSAENNVYTAYSLPLFDTGATITPALAYSKRSGADNMVTARVRVNYTF
jgi:hypothetical protein